MSHDMSAADQNRKHRQTSFFGRRKGHKLRSHQAELVDHLLPKLAIDIAHPPPQRLAELFGTDVSELRLEIGFGGGEHLAACAKAHPEVGFIGCEPFVNGVAKLLATIEADALANVRVRAGDARAFIESLPTGALSRIYALYPDPWPKRRQRKRRLISPAMIDAFARVLAPGGEVRFATDVDDYAGWTLQRFFAARQFEWTARRAEDWLEPWPGWTVTRYEVKARVVGRRSVYLTFRKAK